MRQSKALKLNFKPSHWQCRICQKNGYRFSAFTKTVFENTNYPLKLMGQVDETCIGGKDRNRHKGKKSADLRTAGLASGYAKVGVVGALVTRSTKLDRVGASASPVTR